MGIKLLDSNNTRSSLLLFKYIIENSEIKITRLGKFETAPQIRWGDSSGVYENDWSINPADLIKQSSRIKFAKLMKDSGIKGLYYSRKMPEKYPVVVRTLINAREGKGIVICQNEEEFKKYKGHYWSYWINFNSEFGVHVLGGEIKRKFKKLPIEGEQLFPIRNVKNGFRYSLVSTHMPKLETFIGKIQKVFPAHFVRYDVGWNNEEKSWYVIEANTAPNLSNNKNTLKIYGDFFIKRFTEE